MLGPEAMEMGGSPLRKERNMGTQKVLAMKPRVSTLNWFECGQWRNQGFKGDLPNLHESYSSDLAGVYAEVNWYHHHDLARIDELEHESDDELKPTCAEEVWYWETENHYVFRGRFAGERYTAVYWVMVEIKPGSTLDLVRRCEHAGRDLERFLESAEAGIRLYD
jgi:hypothetical protein